MNVKIPENLEIFDSFIVTDTKLRQYDNVVCSISGGSDSDILLDLLSKCDVAHKIKYVFFDTGMEYQATKDHLKYLEGKYKIEIVIHKAIKPIPTCCKQYGQPFLSKQISEYISRLQRHNFRWEDKPFEELYEEYPKCKVALKWWCNKWGEKSKFNIANNKGLKEFMILHPPHFKISNLCCHYAKKLVAKQCKNDLGCELSITGVRKAEGGARSTVYKNCFSDNSDRDSPDEFRPIFWYKNETKRIYEDFYGITHSRCYSEYGLTRTGCAGCPFCRNLEYELNIIEQYEPKLFKAVNKIFGDSYEYTRKYREFVENKFR